MVTITLSSSHQTDGRQDCPGMGLAIDRSDVNLTKPMALHARDFENTVQRRLRNHSVENV